MDQRESEFTDAVAALIVAWIEFRGSHDVKSAKFGCCEKTERLFEALEQLDHVIGRREQ